MYLAEPSGSAMRSNWLTGNPVQGTVIAQASTQRCRYTRSSSCTCFSRSSIADRARLLHHALRLTDQGRCFSDLSRAPEILVFAELIIVVVGFGVLFGSDRAPRIVSGLRLLDSARLVRQEVPLRARARLDCRLGEAAWIAAIRPDCGPDSTADGSTSTRTTASVRGAYSAPVYGTHPYMLLNYTDTLDDVFTTAHEMGHSMHTILSHETQPFIYSNYTIFVAEVPSTLSEALLLEYMLARSTDPIERIVLLQHAIDNITGTFYTQVLFADYELRAHRLAEQDQPITAEILTETYTQLLKDYYGDAVDLNPLTGLTWARIPHFFNSPVLRLSVRDLFRLGGQNRAGDHGRRPEGVRGAGALSHAAEIGRQRLSDGTAA